MTLVTTAFGEGKMEDKTGKSDDEDEACLREARRLIRNVGVLIREGER